MKKLIAFSLAVVSLAASAACEQMFPFGEVKKSGNYTSLCRAGYAVIHDNQKKIPLMTFEYLTPETIGRGQSERTSFKADPDIPPRYRSTPSDYNKTGKIYDRGHLANAQNAGDDRAMADTMFMSNIVPQVAGFNRGAWKTLETHIAKDVRRGRTLYVITGTINNKFEPLFPKPDETIGKGVVVPTHLFKIVIDKTTNDAIAYMIPNDDINNSYKAYRIGVDQLAKIVDVDFFPAAPTNVKQSLMTATGRTLN
jgi:endonuclease G